MKTLVLQLSPAEGARMRYLWRLGGDSRRAALLVLAPWLIFGRSPGDLLPASSPAAALLTGTAAVAGDG